MGERLNDNCIQRLSAPFPGMAGHKAYLLFIDYTLSLCKTQYPKTQNSISKFEQIEILNPKIKHLFRTYWV